MNETNLFYTKSGGRVTNKMMLETLLSIGADQCDVLFIHTALSFGQPNPQLKKSELLGALLDVIKALGVKTVCMPTFTFSFCNGVDYNPQTSVSRMGVLNEYFRKQEGVVRSIDPLMSVALMGDDKDLVEGIGHSSCGANCTFDKLRHRDNVKFLFLGPKIGDCLTYMHYLEWLYSVDYRYERRFVGNVIVDGVSHKEEYDLFVRYKGVIPNAASYIYEQQMYDMGLAKKVPCGEGTISLVDKDAATTHYKKCLDENPYYFVDFVNGKLVKDKAFLLEEEMVAM
jgi:aminoglycoside 3-N-acetyltransferase